MSFRLPLLHSTRPLTAFQFQAILDAERCAPVYRFSHVFVRDRSGQEYYLCQRHEIATMTSRRCWTLLHEALSYRIRKEDRCSPWKKERTPLRSSEHQKLLISVSTTTALTFYLENREQEHPHYSRSGTSND